VGLYTELFYAIIPTLFLCILLICYPYILLHLVTLLMFYILVYYIHVVGSCSGSLAVIKYRVLLPEHLIMWSNTHSWVRWHHEQH